MSWENYNENLTPQAIAASAADAQRRAAHTAANRMSREDFLRKYGQTFVADDKGGNAASEVAGQDVGAYYDNYLADGATGDSSGFGWKYRDANPYFDAWDNVDPHPESQDLGGVGEFWRQIGRPAATAAATYFGVNALGGLMGGGAAAGEAAGFSGMGGAGGAMGAGADFGLVGAGAEAAGTAAGAAGTAAGTGGFTGSMLMPELAGSMPAGVTSFSSMIPVAEVGTGFLTPAGTLGGATAVGGGLLGSGTAAEGAAAMAAAGGGGGSLWGKATDFLSNPSNLLQVGGTVLGALGGAAASGDTTTSKSNVNEPWSEAKPYLIDNLKTNAAMAEYYRQNPFSDLQKQQYQGLFNNLANNQANMPAMMANANAFGQSKRGQMPAMQGLLSGTQAAPINWSQYENIGRRG